jgi:hypothetical protein
LRNEIFPEYKAPWCHSEAIKLLFLYTSITEGDAYPYYWS